MSEIIADNLTGKTAAGNVTITSEGGSATMQLQQGVAKAWVNFNGTGTIAARDSLNLSSLVDNNTGRYDVNLTNSLNNDDFASVSCVGEVVSSAGDRSASNSPVDSNTVLVGTTSSNNGAYNDNDFVLTTIHGDLA